MYITINDIIGEKRIDLSYAIYQRKEALEGPRSTEIAVVSMLNDNVQRQLLKLCAVMDPISDTKRRFQVELMQVENYSPC